MSSPHLDAGAESLRAGDIPAARRAFELALAEDESGEVLEGLAEALYLEQNYAAAAAHFERAYATYRRRGQNMAAGRAARTVAWITGHIFGDGAVRNGWFARAQSILEAAGERGPERGWVLIIQSFLAPDPEAREALLREAVAVGRRFADPDIECEAVGYLGALLVTTDRQEEGLVLLDEALAAACSGEFCDLGGVDSMFCVFFWACELVNDVPRAEQWMRAAADLMTRRHVVAAFCRAHYGGILTSAGRWTEAETELLEAARILDRELSQRRALAIIRLAELRVRQGRLDEAARLLEGYERHPDAVATMAGLHLARGETALGRDLLERATSGPDDVPMLGASVMIGPLLAMLVDACLDGADPATADLAARRLARLAAAQRGAYLKAAAAFAGGRISVVTGRGDARQQLHDALAGFTRAQLPMEFARTRLEMARALASTAPEMAIVEATAALKDFERLEAARYADLSGALLRSLGAPIRTGTKGVGGLTKREAEILQLLGAGLSNPEIGDRLYITRKTVEHHVSNLLSKLGLRNRAEAAAYATRENLSP